MADNDKTGASVAPPATPPAPLEVEAHDEPTPEDKLIAAGFRKVRGAWRR